MSGKTHAIVGANAVWLAVLAGGIDERSIWLVGAGALAGLLPDIDADKAKIHYLGKGLLKPFRGVFKHRGFFHSLLAVVIVLVTSLLFLTEYHRLLPLVVTAGYASHLLIDGFNFAGTQYLFPIKKKYHLLPKFLATKVNGPVDQLLFILGSMGLLWFMLLVVA